MLINYFVHREGYVTMCSLLQIISQSWWVSQSELPEGISQWICRPYQVHPQQWPVRWRRSLIQRWESYKTRFNWAAATPVPEPLASPTAETQSTSILAGALASPQPSTSDLVGIPSKASKPKAASTPTTSKVVAVPKRRSQKGKGPEGKKPKWEHSTFLLFSYSLCQITCLLNIATSIYDIADRRVSQQPSICHNLHHLSCGCYSCSC
jgi:hypothetical protein